MRYSERRDTRTLTGAAAVLAREGDKWYAEIVGRDREYPKPVSLFRRGFKDHDAAVRHFERLAARVLSGDV